MKKVLFTVFLALLLPTSIKAGSLVPAACQPTLVDNVKIIVCPEGTVLTDKQQERISAINNRLIENQTRREDKIQQLEEKKAQVKEKIEVRKASKAAALEQRNQERVRALWGRLNRKYLAAIERLQILVSRIESRLLKFEGAYPELDVAGVQSQLEDAKELLAQAEADLAASNIEVEDVIVSNTPKESFDTVKDTVVEIKETLKEVHSILVHVIGDIRGLRIGNTPIVQPQNSTNSAEPTAIPVN